MNTCSDATPLDLNDLEFIKKKNFFLQQQIQHLLINKTRRLFSEVTTMPLLLNQDQHQLEPCVYARIYGIINHIVVQ